MDYIKLVAGECSDGIIIINPDQSIAWANAAALAIHHVARTEELGETIDDYHMQFHVKYIAVLPQSESEVRRIAGADRGRFQPEVTIEMQLKTGQNAILRTCKMVLFDQNRRPEGIVFFVRKAPEADDGASRLAGLLQMFPEPVAVLRPEDSTIVAANAAYLTQMAGEEAAAGAHCHWETSVEVDGRVLTLRHLRETDGGAPMLQTDPPVPSADTALAAINGVAMYALDSEMRIVDVSQGWLDWLGYTRPAVINLTVTEFMAVECAERFERLHRADVRTAGRLPDVPANFTTHSGEVVQAIIYAAQASNAATERSSSVFMCVDVTGQEQMEDAWTATFGIVPVPMLVQSCGDDRVIDVNEAFLKVTGYKASDVVGQSIEELGILESKKRRGELEEVLRTNGRGDAADATLKTVHGDSLDCTLAATKIWRFGKPCLLFALQDVSERRRTELELMAALEAVMKDGSWFSQSVVERLAALRAPPKAGRLAAALSDLTPRERDVLSLISLGLPDAEIAEGLGLTKSTIRNHLSTLYSKINVKNRGSAIIWARERCMNVTQLTLRPKTVRATFGAGGMTPGQIASASRGGRMQLEAKNAAAK